LQTNDDFSITVHYTTGSDVVYTENYDGSGTLNFDIDPTRVVDFITFQADTANTNFKITGISLEYTQPIDPSDQDLNFTVSATDADGDVATDAFTVTMIAGTSGNDIISTGANADTVSGGAGADTISTGGGNDILVFDPADFPGTATTVYDGGAGTDTVRFEGASQSLDLTALAQTKVQNVEVIDLTGTGNNSLTLSVQDVLDLSSTTNTLIVDGNGGDTVTATGGWAAAGTQTIGSQTYAAYTATISSQTATLLVDTDVTRVVS
jgi:Ca2+-binding RTX toxin-like protein